MNDQITGNSSWECILHPPDIGGCSSLIDLCSYLFVLPLIFPCGATYMWVLLLAPLQWRNMCRPLARRLNGRSMTPKEGELSLKHEIWETLIQEKGTSSYIVDDRTVKYGVIVSGREHSYISDLGLGVWPI